MRFTTAAHSLLDDSDREPSIRHSAAEYRAAAVAREPDGIPNLRDGTSNHASLPGGACSFGP
jgi:hypothetical protein